MKFFRGYGNMLDTRWFFFLNHIPLELVNVVSHAFWNAFVHTKLKHKHKVHMFRGKNNKQTIPKRKQQQQQHAHTKILVKKRDSEHHLGRLFWKINMSIYVT